MRRGFKTWCEKEAAEIRKNLGLKDYDALNWEVLSKRMGIPVLDAASLPIAEKDRNQLFQKDHKSWDAFTVTNPDGKHMIFYNSKQPAPRITNTIMHELAHIICEHVPSSIMNMGLPVRTCDTQQEEEADWLSGSLLLPRTALLNLLKKGMKEEYIAQQFRVSSELLRYRINITGVKRQIKATKQS